VEINLDGISTLTFTLTNPPANTVPLTGVAFSDDYPAGLENASPLTAINGCGGSLTASGGGTSLALTGGTIPVDSSCNISVEVTGTSVGDKLNLSDYVTSTNGGQGNRASNALTVSDPTVIDPAVTKAVDPSEAQVGDPVTFTLTVFNEGGGDAADVVVTDQIPAFLDITSVDVDPSGPTVDITGNLITIDFGTLAFDDFYTVTIETVVNAAGQPRGGTNQVDLTTSSDDDDPDNNTDSVEVDLIVLGSASAPETGFAPSRRTRLPEQPASLVYTEYQGLWLEIPSQGIDMEIVGVPLGVEGWDVTWLSDQAGYLAGTAFPTWQGNSVITGHAVLPSGLPGAFAVLPELQYGDQIVIHAWGTRYHYEIRESEVLRPNDASIFRHEEQSWLTLLTCQGYDRWSESYLRRRVVRAVLMKVEGDG
jgi:LPXTG-site transpeptidase (sortase) family protein